MTIKEIEQRMDAIAKEHSEIMKRADKMYFQLLIEDPKTKFTAKNFLPAKYYELGNEYNTLVLQLFKQKCEQSKRNGFKS